MSVTVDISAAVVGGGGSSGTRNKTVATYWPFRRLQQSTGEVNARGALRLPRRRRIRCLPLNNSCRTERKKTREMRFFVASERAKSHTRLHRSRGEQASSRGRFEGVERLHGQPTDSPCAKIRPVPACAAA